MPLHAKPLIESAPNIPPRRWGVTAQFRQAFSLSSGARHCLECQSVVEGSETTAATEVLSSNTLLFCTCVGGNLEFAGYALLHILDDIMGPTLKATSSTSLQRKVRGRVRNEAERRRHPPSSFQTGAGRVHRPQLPARLPRARQALANN